MLLFTGGLLYSADDNEVEIKGGFGYLLGEDGSKLKGSRINDDTIEIQAKSSFRNFNKCWVSINDEKQIYLISSTVNYDSEKETDREYKIILNLLEKKYKATFEDTTSNVRNSDKSITPEQVLFSLKRNNKNILLRKYSKAIRLYYWDTVLNNTQRERKKRSSEQEKNNDMNAL